MPVIDSRGTRPVVQSGDKAFVEQKEREGKLKSDTGILTTTGDLATLTAGAGKDMFISEVTCAVTRGVFTSLLTRNAQIDLKVNGVVVESYIYQDFISSGESKSNSGTFEFKWRGKVSAGQIIKLEVITLETDLQATGMVQCYEESSGSQTFGGQQVTINATQGREINLTDMVDTPNDKITRPLNNTDILHYVHATNIPILVGTAQTAHFADQDLNFSDSGIDITFPTKDVQFYLTIRAQNGGLYSQSWNIRASDKPDTADGTIIGSGSNAGGTNNNTVPKELTLPAGKYLTLEVTASVGGSHFFSQTFSLVIEEDT